MYDQNSEGNVLLRKCAQEIAAAVASAINFDVIITDTEGVIVGSSDKDRLEQFHEASLPVVASGQNARTGERQAQQLRGTLPGVTAPIQSMNGQIAGTVAIAGDPEKWLLSLRS